MVSSILIRRSYSNNDGSYKYESVASGVHLSEARSTAYKAGKEPGDILITCDTAYVSDLPKKAIDIYVVDELGNTKATNDPSSRLRESGVTWLDAWEGEESKATEMLSEAVNYPEIKEEIALCACAIARTAIKHVPNNTDTRNLAIKATEDCVLGKATLEHLHECRVNMINAYSNGSIKK